MTRFLARLPAFALTAAVLIVSGCSDLLAPDTSRLDRPLAPSFNTGYGLPDVAGDQLYLIDNNCGTSIPGASCTAPTGSDIYRVSLTGGEAVLSLVKALHGDCTANSTIDCNLYFNQAHIGGTPDGTQVWAINRNNVSEASGWPAGYVDVASGNFIYVGAITGLGSSGIVMAAFSPAGELFVANQSNNTIYRIRISDLAVTGSWTTSINLDGADLAFDVHGTMFIFTNDRFWIPTTRGLYVVTLNGGGTATTTARGASGDQFFTGLAFRGQGTGNLVMSNAVTDEIREVNPLTGATFATYKMKLGGIAFDHQFGDMATGRLGPPSNGVCPTSGTLGGVNLGTLTDYLFVFSDGRSDANWQAASKGYKGNVAVNGLLAKERSSGSFAYAGTIFTNDNTLDGWQRIINNNTSQATAVFGQAARLTQLESWVKNSMLAINAMLVTAGFESVSATSLNGINTQDGIAETFVINVTSGFGVKTKINITGDADDVFILRWDTDANPANGYQGQVKFQSGGAIVPLGGLRPGNFIHVAGDINASGGGSNPVAPGYPQGTGLPGTSNFSGGGFFTGYWLTTGKPTTLDAVTGLYFGETSSMSNAIFVGGWYSITTKFSMTSGTSGVHVCPT